MKLDDYDFEQLEYMVKILDREGYAFTRDYLEMIIKKLRDD